MPPRKKAATTTTKLSAKELLNTVNEKLGTNAVFMGSDERLEVEYFSTGYLPFDILLQGGVPRGRMIEIFGDWSVLKSVICLSTAAQVQKQGGTVALLDTEHAYEPKWATRLGVDTSELIVWPPRDDDEEHTGEEAIDVAQVLCANKVDLIIFDSVAAATPQAETTKRLKNESVQPARLAQLMSTGLRKLTMTNDKTAFIFTNQTRLNIGVTFGSKESRPGGKALGYYASMILDVKKVGKVSRDVKTFDGENWITVKEQTGQKYRAQMQKSKLSKPFKEVWFTWNLETGEIDMPEFLIAQSLELGKITVRGNTWEGYGVKAVGRKKFKNAFSAETDAIHAAELAIREHHGLDTSHLTVPTPKKATRRTSKALRTRRG